MLLAASTSSTQNCQCHFVVVVVLQYFGGFTGLVWTYSVPFVIVQTMTLGLNTVCHMWGSRPYDTGVHGYVSMAVGANCMTICKLAGKGTSACVGRPAGRGQAGGRMGRQAVLLIDMQGAGGRAVGLWVDGWVGWQAVMQPYMCSCYSTGA